MTCNKGTLWVHCVDLRQRRHRGHLSTNSFNTQNIQNLIFYYPYSVFSELNFQTIRVVISSQQTTRSYRTSGRRRQDVCFFVVVTKLIVVMEYIWDTQWAAHDGRVAELLRLDREQCCCQPSRSTCSLPLIMINNSHAASVSWALQNVIYIS